MIVASNLPQAIASGLIPGLTLAAISALMSMRHDRAAIVGGRKVLSYGIGPKLLGIVGFGMAAYAAAVPIAIFLRDPAELTDHPFKFIGGLAMSIALGWVMALLPFEVFLRGVSYDDRGIHRWRIGQALRFAAWSDVMEVPRQRIQFALLATARWSQDQDMEIQRRISGVPEFPKEQTGCRLARCEGNMTCCSQAESCNGC